MVYTYYSVLYGGFENEKKMGKKNLTFRSGYLNPGFLNNFPSLDLNFHGRWGWWDRIQATFFQRLDITKIVQKAGENSREKIILLHTIIEPNVHTMHF